MGDIDAITPGFVSVSATNHGAWVIVASWIFILNTILVTLVRLGWRYRVTRTVPIDDWIMVAATAVALAETITLSLSCRHGLGRHLDSLSDIEYQKYSKSFYASQILLVAAVGLSKISVTQTVVALRPYNTLRRICYGLQAFNALWMVAGILSLALQCSLPRPWDSISEKCVDQYSLQIGIWSASFLSDLAIIILPAVLMSRVQVTIRQKLSVSLLFGSRIVVIVLTIVALIVMRNFYKSSPHDPTWFAVDPMIYFQIMLNLALITASIPTIKRFLMEFRTGVFGAELPVDFEESTSGKRGFSNPALNSSSRKRSDFKSHTMRSNGSMNVYDSRDPGLARVERSESIRGLTDNIILQTIDFEVQYEDGPKQKVSADVTSVVETDSSRPRSQKSSKAYSERSK